MSEVEVTVTVEMPDGRFIKMKEVSFPLAISNSPSVVALETLEIAVGRIRAALIL